MRVTPTRSKRRRRVPNTQFLLAENRILIILSLSLIILTTVTDIHPEFARMLGRAAKESLLGQRGHVFWLYGLSGSGKSTLAHRLERELHSHGRMTTLLDGDNLRTGLNAGLGFTDADRAENIRRAAEVAKLFADNGIITIASFICPKTSLRALARETIGSADFSEIYVKASFAACQQRDVKGLYAKAAAGQIASFTGKDSGFEEPTPASPADLVLDTENSDIEACLSMLMAHVSPRISPVTL